MARESKKDEESTCGECTQEEQRSGYLGVQKRRLSKYRKDRVTFTLPLSFLLIR